MSEERPDSSRIGLLLKRGDQATAAFFTLAALLAIGVYWWQQGGWQGRLIEVDQLPVRSVAFKIDVNTAPWTELSQAPEIGETLAKRIVEYRDKHGPFASIEALLEVSGIGPRTLEQMRPYLKEIAPTATPGP